MAKAKALRVYVEPLITKSKNDTTHNRRLVFSKLQNKEVVQELFDHVGAKVADRPGGYTRIIKLQSRVGDAAEMAMIELVDYNTTYVKGAKSAETRRTRRSRRGGAKANLEKAAESTDTEVDTKEQVSSEVENSEVENNQVEAIEEDIAEKATEVNAQADDNTADDAIGQNENKDVEEGPNEKAE